ncbi:hypothetical protein B566_EDAN015228 [Ephemera danica]|nr:hypothetical protein B566_EDAN015228 [Ephemera danica]
MRILLCVLALLGTALAHKSYEGYQVLQTEDLPDVSSVRKLASLHMMEELDFWQTPRVGGRATIMVPKHLVAPVKFTLATLGLNPTVLIPNVETIGSSYEGRPMRVLKLANGPSAKPAIFFDSAIHAREWMGPPTVMYVINELTDNLGANQAILDKNDFYFLLVSNPDGYTFTWSDDRLWRKTRSPNSGSNCIGTDPNRNFDQNWAGGGTGIPCSETYAGSAPFSEPETKAISDFIAATPSITFAQSVHSYGQYLLHPYGDSTDLPPNVAELTRVGTDALDALQAVSGTRYTLGSVANVLYFAYGSTTDWSYVQQGIDLSYTIELPGGGSAGFNPPPSDIQGVVTETWEAYKVFFQNIPNARR